MVGHGFVSKKTTDGSRELNATLESLVLSYPDEFGMLKTNQLWTVRNDVLIACNRQKFNDPKSEQTPRMHGKLTASFCGGDVQPNHMGPELGFGWSVGDALNVDQDEKILLIKVAWGGKSLEEDFRPPSSGNETGVYYTTMIRDVKAFIANIGKYFPEEKNTPAVLSGFGWHQGWNDLINVARAADYESNLANLIRDIRKDLNVSDLPFVIAATAMSDISKNDRAAEVFHAEMNVATYEEFNGTVITVDTRGFRRLPPPSSPGGQGYHWYNNAESYWLIGQGLGQAMVQLVQRREKSRPHLLPYIL